MKKALIFGVTGQDGSYLSEFLLDKGYEVYGVKRRSSSYNTARIDHIYDNKNFHLVYGDVTDSLNVTNLISSILPDEIYNLSAQSISSDSLCPIMTATGVSYRTLEDVWNEQISKHKIINVVKSEIGDIEVIELSDNSQMKALGYWNGMGSWFKIKQVSRHFYKGQICKLNQKFGSIKVTPNHSILDVNQKVRMPIENPWLLNVRKINYDRNIKTEIDLKLDGVYEKDEEYFWLEESGKIGKVKRKLKDESLFHFCKFLGAFVSEGHITCNKVNKSYFVGISEQRKEWLEDIKNSLYYFYDGNSCFIKHKKELFDDVWELQIKSRTLYSLLKKLCGENSKTRKIPDWVFCLDDTNLKILFETLIEGDGCYTDIGRYRYTTSSYTLACQFSLLNTLLNYDYTVYEESGGYYHFRECKQYQIHQGEDSKKIEMIDYEGYVYDISVDEVSNFTTGVGNIVVHNSHVKVSFDIPEYTANVDALGTLRILESIRLLGLETHTRFYQACYDEQTKVFTNNGIKTFSEIDKNDKVFTINEITHKLELKPIDKIHVYDFSGEMIKISGKRIDLLVTPNHKLILKYDNEDVLKYCDADNLFTELNKTEKSNISLPKTKFSVDTHNKTINLKDYFDFNFKKNHTMNLIESIETNDLLYLIGLYIGDGYFGSKKKYIVNSLNAVNRDAKGKFSKGEYIPKEIEVNSGWICFAIPKKDKSREELEYILNKNNIKFTAKDNTIEFSSYVLSEIFRTCGCGAKNKNIPEWAFNFPNESLIRLSDGLVGSDGHKRKNKITYTTISQKLANDVVRLYTYLGYYSTLTCRKPRLGKIGDREFKTANITYYITINYNSTDNKIYKQYISKENYIGKVWCLTVKDNHNFMVLRGNKICFSGNSTSELYGLVQEIPQTETTPFYPRSPYACAKIFGYWIVKNYREAYNMFACNGILFNHESSRRGETFVTRKITIGLNAIKNKQQTCLYLGNLNALRDWSHAKDMVNGMWMMLQHKIPDDFVLASGKQYSVKQFVERCAPYFGMDIVWEGEGMCEVGVDRNTNLIVIRVHPKYFRPTEVETLLGNPAKAKRELGWEPKITFDDLVREMCEYELGVKNV